MTTDKKEKKKLSLSSKILIGMGLGIIAGLFFGEYCAFLQIVGDAFILLLQATILPYIVVSMISAIGGLNMDQAKLLARRAGILLLLFWGIIFVIILAMPLSFPSWESAAFFSTSSIEPAKEVDFLRLYIPANLFYSLANNIVPAVVVFSILMGMALMGIQDKDGLLGVLQTVSQAMVRMTNMIVTLTPVGVFALTAAAAGTMTVEEFDKLQVYLVSFNMAAVLLSFWILPMIVAAVTPFRYKDIVGFTRDALVTAFTTGNLFVVLAVLTENCKKLFEEYKLKEEKTDAYVDVIIPLSFNFPNAGKLLILLFVLFAAWFSGNTLSLTQYPTFVFAGLLSFFGGVDVAIPFLLDLLKIPADLYQLYVVTTVLNGRFATLLAAMNLVVFTLMATASLTGAMKISKKKIINFAITSVLLTVGVIGVTRGYFTLFLENVYDKDRVIANMQSQVYPIPRKVYDSVTKSLKPIDFNKPALQRIRETGVLRVGFDPERLPFTYFGESGELIGFDVDMAQLLAREMKVKLEFIPFEHDLLSERLQAGHFDVIMSGIAITTPDLEEMTFSDPYMEANLCFVVPDYRRKDFATEKSIRRIPGLSIGIPQSTEYFLDKIKDYLPEAEIVVLDTLRDYFEANELQLDGMIMDAEGGSAWTLTYPSHNVVIPMPDIVQVPLAYPVAGRDLEFANFLSQWIKLKKDSGEFQILYDHWILGKDAVPKKPRWSIIRDVLGWI